MAVGTGAFNILVSCDNSPKDLPRDAYDSAPVSVVPSWRTNCVCFCFFIDKESVWNLSAHILLILKELKFQGTVA